jgi:hypothetical protein
MTPKDTPKDPTHTRELFHANNAYSQLHVYVHVLESSTSTTPIRKSNSGETTPMLVEHMHTLEKTNTDKE